MNKLKIYCILIIAGMLSFSACENQPWEFDDFDYTAAYFPYQSPVRTLVLDEYYDINQNSNDLDMTFLISVVMGGAYENTRNIQVEWVVDESLAENVMNSLSGQKMELLPADYYESTQGYGSVTIPPGRFTGGIEVQLTEDFLNDSASAKTHYILPLRIIRAQTDSVLRGKPLIESPDRRKNEEWEIPPKDFTLFGVKYVNKYHGTYLLRGASVIKDAETGEVIDRIAYRQRFVERDEVKTLQTFLRNSVTYNGAVRLPSGSPGNFEVVVAFDENENATLVPTDSADFIVSGSGKYSVNTENWGQKDRNAIYLDYVIYQDSIFHEVKDTLVFRDKNVAFEEFIIQIEE